VGLGNFPGVCIGIEEALKYARVHEACRIFGSCRLCGSVGTSALPFGCDVIGSFRRFYGPTMNAFEAAEKNGREEELHNQLLELAQAQNQDSNGGTFIPATFLRVTVCV
jgi:hypothetical protein